MSYFQAYQSIYGFEIPTMKCYAFLVTLVLITFSVQAQRVLSADTNHPATRHLYSAVAESILQSVGDGRVLVGGNGNMLNGRTIPRYFLVNAEGQRIEGFSNQATLNYANVITALPGPAKTIYLSVIERYASNMDQSRTVLQRVDSLGQPDLSFHPVEAHKVNNQFRTRYSAQCVKQNDGKIILATGFDTLAGHFAPYWGRVNQDGTFDTTFQRRFTITNPIYSRNDPYINDFKRFADGNMYLQLSGGYNTSYDGNPIQGPGGNQSWPVIFVRPDGSYVRFLKDSAYLIELAGIFKNHLYILCYKNQAPNTVTLNTLKRVRSDGRIDSSFSPVSFPNSRIISITANLTDSSIIALVSTAYSIGSAPCFQSIKILSNGLVDTSWHPHQAIGYIKQLVSTKPGVYLASVITTPDHMGLAMPSGLLKLDSSLLPSPIQPSSYCFLKPPNKIISQPDGRYYVTGAEQVDTQSKPYLHRYWPNGTLDTSFCVRPEIPVSDMNLGYGNNATSILVRHNGNLLLSGDFSYNLQGRRVLGLIALKSDGHLDTDFTPPLIKWNEYIPYIRNICEDASGHIYLTGNIDRCEGHYVRNLIRLLPNGRYDSSFHIQDSVYTNSGLDICYPDRDGTILTDGHFIVNGHEIWGITRLTHSGRVDMTFPLTHNTSYRLFQDIKKIQEGSDGSLYLFGKGSTLTYSLPVSRLTPLNRNLDSAWMDTLGKNLLRSRIRAAANGYEDGSLLPDGSMLITGRFNDPNRPFIRIMPDANLDTSLVFDNLVTTPGTSNILPLQDGNVLVSGKFYFTNSWQQDFTILPNRTIMAYDFGLISNYKRSLKTILEISPNPAHTLLTIQGPAGSFTSTLQDLTGHTVRTGTGPSLNLQGLAPGLYVLKVDGYTPTRVVVE